MSYDLAIDRMIRDQLEARGIADPRVLEAMRRVERHRFVPGRPPAEAYADRALPTAEGQTISQPYIVARMTELLEVQPGHRVLEVGTGSGYQTAVLVAMGASVVTVERHAALAEAAEARFKELGIERKVEVVIGDGTRGHPEGAPYSRMIVTAAAPDLPATLHSQLTIHGRVVIPVGTRASQVLAVFRRRLRKSLTARMLIREDHEPCRFVPLLGEQGFAVGGHRPL